SVEECYRRSETVVPQQALVMSNSRLVLTRAEELAASISREVGSDDSAAAQSAFITSAFERVLGRVPTLAEQAECRNILAEFRSVAVPPSSPGLSPAARARASLVNVLLNHNDFITVR